MNVFTIYFFSKFLQNILQNAPNCTIIKNFLGGACPRTPWQVRGKAPCKYPHFSKNILNPPPPPSRNEILVTPLMEIICYLIQL